MPIRIHERSQNDLSFHLNKLENKEQIKLKVKVRVEVKYSQNRKIETNKRTMKPKMSSLRMSVK